jgi:hypothetical protein
MSTLWTIRQRARVFDPFVTVVQKGDRVEFPNDDDMLHHVYSTSPAKTFDIKLYRGTSTPVQFDIPGTVAIGCNVHDWMLAYIVVLETRSYAKTDREGVARLGNVLPGRFSLSAWYPGMRRPAVLGEVVVVGGNNPMVEHSLNVPIRSRPKPPPFDPLRY